MFCDWSDTSGVSWSGALRTECETLKQIRVNVSVVTDEKISQAQNAVTGTHF